VALAGFGLNLFSGGLRTGWTAGDGEGATKGGDDATMGAAPEGTAAWAASTTGEKMERLSADGGGPRVRRLMASAIWLEDPGM
jgi:hypothetical protein